MVERSIVYLMRIVETLDDGDAVSVFHGRDRRWAQVASDAFCQRLGWCVLEYKTS
jgi:hypothetical protein